MTERITSYLTRIVRHDSFRRGVATAGAAVLVAAFCEAAWPTKS